ncbi:glucose-6-phosphate dehydrogenase assembly protein OpcA [Conexibacter sp. DBS9H8]|uniref:glucose-6-phosphate dehydrogenase assembly protein OpcA n=1 Tax=Conexibacter sp. DBS9H8 TaxID=2937801 RepID=UPI00200D7C84|nr:glucose-6-phosphate dehydrogenase assembly protein OpcA [Conexibacter sp. DBS9H8]
MAEQSTWEQQDTTPERVEAALRRLLHERHRADASLVPARVLNLVVIADREWRGEIINRLERVGRYHASRTILCSVADGARGLDARVILSAATEGAGVSISREWVELRLGTDALANLATILDPLLVPELQTVLWSPHSRDEAVESLLGMVDVLLIDTDDPANFDGPGAALARSWELQDRTYIVDLAWLRTTPWRERLAAAFDDPSRRDELPALSSVVVRHNPNSLTSALLLSGWLASRLAWIPEPLVVTAGGAYRGTAAAQRGGGAHDVAFSGVVGFDFEPVDQPTPGIAAVSVGTDYGFSLALSRDRGGLLVRERRPAPAPTRLWRTFGASRGEAGILGEGVRQALLRDSTYRPALASARRFQP